MESFTNVFSSFSSSSEKRLFDEELDLFHDNLLKFGLVENTFGSIEFDEEYDDDNNKNSKGKKKNNNELEVEDIVSNCNHDTGFTTKTDIIDDKGDKKEQNVYTGLDGVSSLERCISDSSMANIQEELCEERDDPLKAFRDTSENSGAHIIDNDDSKTGALTEGSNSMESSATKASKNSVDVEKSIYFGAVSTSTSKRKKLTVTVFTLTLYINKAEKLGISIRQNREDSTIYVKELSKSADNSPGIGENAGLKVGDVMLGVNYEALGHIDRAIMLLGEAQRNGKGFIKLNILRKIEEDTNDIPIGSIEANADICNMIKKTHTLLLSKRIDARQSFRVYDFILRGMLQLDEERDSSLTNYPCKIRENFASLVLKAKGLREGICVRLTHARYIRDRVVYTVRVEDIRAGKYWLIERRYSDFYDLYQKMLKKCPQLDQIPFPKKRLAVAGILIHKIIDERMVSLEIFLRECLYRMTSCAVVDYSVGEALLIMNKFLNLNQYVDVFRAPICENHKIVEMIIFKMMQNQKTEEYTYLKEIASTFNDVIKKGKNDYEYVLQDMGEKIMQLQNFIYDRHKHEFRQVLNDSIYCNGKCATEEMLRMVIRRAIRRQAESSLFTPNRRAIMKLLHSKLSHTSEYVHKVFESLQKAPPSFFHVDPRIKRTQSFQKAVDTLRRLVHYHLPCDQMFSMRFVVNHVLNIHSELAALTKKAVMEKKYMRRVETSPKETGGNADDLSSLRKYLDEVKISKIFKTGEDTRKDFINVSRQSSSENLNLDLGSSDSSSSSDDENNSQEQVVVNHETVNVTLTKVENDDKDIQTSDNSNTVDHNLKTDDNTDSSNDNKAIKDDSSNNTDKSESISTTEVTTAPNEKDDAFQLDDDTESLINASEQGENTTAFDAMSADDFLPLLSFILVHSAPSHLMLIKEILQTLTDPEESIGEIGYYMASLEASLHHIIELWREAKKPRS